MPVDTAAREGRIAQPGSGAPSSVNAGAAEATVSAPASPMLRFDRDPKRVSLGELDASPRPFEDVKSEVAPQRSLDYLAVASTRAFRLGAHGAQDALVERDTYAHFRHRDIMASPVLFRLVLNGQGAYQT
jgi:hypothetical protein